MSDNHRPAKVRPNLTGVKIMVVGWQAGEDPAKSQRPQEVLGQAAGPTTATGQSIKFPTPGSQGPAAAVRPEEKRPC